jgi:hypothetical protein
MTSEATRPSSREVLDPATRLALRLYPDSWREHYGAEVADTLLELRRRRPGDRLEVLHLALRGLWLRARSSSAFWGGLLLVASTLWAATDGRTPFLEERYWPALLSLPASGAFLLLPLAASISALQGHRHRMRTASLRDPKRRVVTAAWAAAPVLAALAVGYALVLVLALLVSGLPAAGDLTALLVPVSLLALAAGAVSVGFVFGSLMPRAVAAPLVGVLLYAWFRMPEPIGGSVLAWRQVTGVGLTWCCLWLDVVPNFHSQLIVILTGALLTGVAGALIRMGPSRRQVGTAVVAAVSVVAVLVAVTPLVPRLGERGEVQRDFADLQCEGKAPQICLWPEQQAEYADRVRPVITDAYRRGLAAGLPMRTAVAPYIGSLGQGQKTGSPIDEVPMRLTDTDSDILTAYGSSVYASEACPIPDANATTADLYREIGVQYAIAVLLGADETAVLPQMEHSAEERLPAIRYTPDEVRDLIGVHDQADARAAVERWLASCGS